MHRASARAWFAASVSWVVAGCGGLEAPRQDGPGGKPAPGWASVSHQVGADALLPVDPPAFAQEAALPESDEPPHVVEDSPPVLGHEEPMPVEPVEVEPLEPVEVEPLEPVGNP